MGSIGVAKVGATDGHSRKMDNNRMNGFKDRCCEGWSGVRGRCADGD